MFEPGRRLTDGRADHKESPRDTANRESLPKKYKRQGYLRRGFSFAVAMAANGGATVMSTRTKTITKPNMIFLAFFGFSV
jgi:hypothetical protein